MDNFIIIAAICMGIMLVGAFVERVSGFGMGIVVMTVFPFLFATFGEATALSGLVSFLSTSYIALRYRKSIRWKLVLWPLITYIPINYLAILLIADSDMTILKRALGIFLILLSLYFIWFGNRLHIHANAGTGLATGTLSGFLGGAFSTSGPPIVVYLIGEADQDKAAYIATIQCVFAITGCVSNIGRVIKGFVTERVLCLLPIALVGMALGNFIGGKVYQKLNADTLKKCVYAFMSLAGILILLSTLGR